MCWFWWPYTQICLNLINFLLGAIGDCNIWYLSFNLDNKKYKFNDNWYNWKFFCLPLPTRKGKEMYFLEDKVPKVKKRKEKKFGHIFFLFYTQDDKYSFYIKVFCTTCFKNYQQLFQHTICFSFNTCSSFIFSGAIHYAWRESDFLKIFPSCILVMYQLPYFPHSY